MEQWERSYYISSLAGADNGGSFVVMSKGKPKVYNVVLPRSLVDFIPTNVK